MGDAGGCARRGFRREQGQGKRGRGNDTKYRVTRHLGRPVVRSVGGCTRRGLQQRGGNTGVRERGRQKGDAAPAVHGTKGWR